MALQKPLVVDPVHNSQNPFKFGEPEKNVILQMLSDFGVPIATAYPMIHSYFDAKDFLLDVREFLDNFDRFKQLQEAASSLNIDFVEDLASDKLEQLTQEIISRERWSNVCSIFPNGDQVCSTTEQIEEHNAIQQQMSALREFRNKWHKVFGSKNAMQAKADELLQRQQWLKIIQIGLVFKDLVLGINEMYKTSKKLALHRKELERILQEFVHPIMDSFNRTGRFDNNRAETAMMQLRYIKAQCEEEQSQSKSSFFGHLVNGISIGIQAYATYANVGALAKYASASVLKSSQILGAVQGTLSVGSFVCSGIEAYNYIQYNNIIDDVENVICSLEHYKRAFDNIQ